MLNVRYVVYGQQEEDPEEGVVGVLLGPSCGEQAGVCHLAEHQAAFGALHAPAPLSLAEKAAEHCASILASVCSAEAEAETFL